MSKSSSRKYKRMEVLHQGVWEDIQFEHIHQGDVFRDKDDPMRQAWRATAEPTPCDSPGNYTIECLLDEMHT